MIDRVGTVSLFVNDQDRAKDFYTRILGFELRQDAPLYPGATNRWVAVAPKQISVTVNSLCASNSFARSIRLRVRYSCGVAWNARRNARKK